jgi:hypothetical protein
MILHGVLLSRCKLNGVRRINVPQEEVLKVLVRHTFAKMSLLRTDRAGASQLMAIA